MVGAVPFGLRVSKRAVKEARKASGLKRRELCCQARVTVAYVKSLERGIYPNSTIGPLSRVAAVLGVELTELLEPAL